MREKLQTLPLAELKEIAKSQGIKGISGMKKGDLIELLCAKDKEIEEKKKPAPPPRQESVRESGREYTRDNTKESGRMPRNQSTYQNPGANPAGAAGPKSYSPPPTADGPQDMPELDSGIEANGILEVMPDGFGFIRCENFLPGENDVYVAPSQIRRFNMKTGDIIRGNRRIKAATEKFAALLYVTSINGYPPSVIERRPNFEDLTPIFPNVRLHMETRGRNNSTAMRVLDLLSPIGKGQRGMIVSPPKAGKTDRKSVV